MSLWTEASERPRVFVEQSSEDTFMWLAVDVDWKLMAQSGAHDYSSFGAAERAALEVYPNARFFSSSRKGSNTETERAE